MNNVFWKTKLLSWVCSTLQQTHLPCNLEFSESCSWEKKFQQRQPTSKKWLIKSQRYSNSLKRFSSHSPTRLFFEYMTYRMFNLISEFPYGMRIMTTHYLLAMELDHFCQLKNVMRHLFLFLIRLFIKIPCLPAPINIDYSAIQDAMLTFKAGYFLSNGKYFLL